MQDNPVANRAEGLRSVEALNNVNLRFVNLTNKTIEMIWINYSGLHVRYKLLQELCFFDINTYETHPWLARDVITKDRLWLDRTYIYMPQSVQESINNNPNLRNPVVASERRKVVYITLPVYSLRYGTLLAIRNYIKEPEQVDQLGLPQAVGNDLKDLIRLRNRVLIDSSVLVACQTAR